MSKCSLKSKSQFYAIVGFNTTVEEDVERLNMLADAGVNVFIMFYNKGKNIKPNPEAIKKTFK